ncbi:MAG: hypothetical protein JWM98_1673 [Thermoleophilia bacterium]|nr:hypothetical protein [Thermoleophilia bacterium]
MITPASIMRPLPIRPIDGMPDAAPTTPATAPRAPRRMQPLTIEHTRPGAADLVGSLRDAAFQRMLDRLGKTDLGTVTDPTA